MYHVPSAIFMILLVWVAAPASAQEQVQLSPTAFLEVKRDPIEDTDFSSVSVQSVRSDVGGIGKISWACYGQYSTLSVSWPEAYLPVRAIVWRFDTGRPDTLHIEAGPPRRIYGEGFVRIVFNKPIALETFPDSTRRAFTTEARAAQRLVLRLVRDEGRIDLYFDLSGTSRGLDRLSCLRAAPVPRPALLGRANSTEEDVPDVGPLPVDSAAVGEALMQITPADQNAFVIREALVDAKVGSSGAVDSVQVFAITDPAVERKVEELVRAIRFRPGERNGRPLAARVLFHITVGRGRDY
ncbi:MAG TPA: hypothetical protein VFR81_13280 [Longimicrobium sp.]|nr:hypothetical protein [Longimicrobium sp.]